MKIAYLHCFSGISGDMAVGAFLDAGLGLDRLKAALGKLGLEGYEISMERVLKGGIGGTQFIVKVRQALKHRTFSDIEKIISRSSLDGPVKESALGIFRKLAEAESKIHGVPLGDVHFHEIGAVDSIVDIVGCAVAVDALGIDEIHSSSVALGSGFVKTMHGTLPVPAPATLELLRGVPVVQGGAAMELTTPTGAAILAYFCRGYGDMPPMKVLASGYGAGSADLEIPNLLRVVIGERVQTDAQEKVVILETNIDDMNPELYEYVAERLFAEGALDVNVIPMMMKKFRPAVMLRVVASPEKKDALERIIFRETTTAGIRHYEAGRTALGRDVITVKTVYGELGVKVLHGADGDTFSPEYDECKKAAAQYRVPLREVYDAAREAAKKLK